MKLFVCDQRRLNRAAYKLLDITEKKPFFEHAEKNIFAFHDFPHIVENVVSRWKRYTILIVLGEEISFQDIISTWNADRDNKLSNTLGHISLEQMFLNNFERQNVRKAKVVTPPKIDGTIWFVGKVNTVVDVCNSSNIYDSNPLKPSNHPFEALEGTVRGLLAVYRELV